MRRRCKLATNNSPLAHHFADLEQQHEVAVLGMWVFLATELMVFGALFTGYAVYRAAYPAEFAAGSGALNIWFGGINTVVLLSSSLTMALGVHGAQLGRRHAVVTYLALTALLGTAFLVIKGFEYHNDYVERLVPGLAFNDQDWLRHEPPLNPGKVKLFLLFYYTMTGLHGVHLLIGIVFMTVLTILASRGRFTPQYYGPIEVGGLYWHFVDVVWLFLLPLLYLIGPR
jgi:cytochrome c oxidase subunit III